MVKVKLSVLNRFSLLGLLSNKGDLTTLKVIRELREELSFTEDEHALLNFTPTSGNKLTWNEKVDPHKEFEFSGIREILIEEVKTQLRTSEEKKTLELDYLSLYEVLIEKVGPVLVKKEKKA